MNFLSDFTLTIAGQAVGSKDVLPVLNPATREIVAEAPIAGADQLEAAVAAATSALIPWRSAGWDERQDRLTELARAIETHAEDLGLLFTLEQGRPLRAAIDEIRFGARWLKTVARQRVADEFPEDSDARTVRVVHEPLGVVAAIVPWNFPFLLAIWKIAPALIAGNTMVLKPSPFTPLCALKLGEIARDILPPGVLNILSGGDELGPLMTAHPGFAKISFTGSTATGKRIMAVAANDLKRVTLELGGNDAAIILPDVDVDAVARQIFSGAFYNSAQVCIATKRLFIHTSIYDRLRDRLHEMAQAAVVGDGRDPKVMFGPVQNEPQYRRVRALIDQARADGLVLLDGGPVPDEGFFIPLTLVDNPPDDAAVVREEAFGPVLPLLRFESVDEAVSRANASEYGLAGAVWTSDIDRAVAVAERLETGTVWINQNLQNGPHIPFGGYKQSGIGVENGDAGLRAYLQPKTIFIPKPARS